MTQFQASPWEPVRSYDVPGILAAQLLEGELSLTSIKNSLFAPDKLSLEERTNLQDMFIGQDADPLSRTVVGIATNPLAWLAILPGVRVPAGLNTLKKSGRLFDPHRTGSAFQRAGGWLHSLGLTSTLELFEGTPFQAIAMKTQAVYRELVDESLKFDGVARAQLLERLQAKNKNITSLNPRDIKDAAARAELEEVMDAIGARKFRLDDNYMQFTTEMEGQYFHDVVDAQGKVQQVEIGRDLSRADARHMADQADLTRRHMHAKWGQLRNDGRTDLTFKKWMARNLKEGETAVISDSRMQGHRMTRRPSQYQEALVDKQWVDDVFQKYDLDPVVQTLEEGQLRMYTRLLGDEVEMAQSGTFVVDREKSMRILAGLKNKLADGNKLDSPLPREMQGEAILRELLGEDVLGAVERGNLTLGEFDRLLQDTLGPTPGKFVPRVVRDTVPLRYADKDGGITYVHPSKAPLGEKSVQPDSLDVTNRIVPQTDRELRWHPQELERFERRGALTAAGRQHAADGWAKSKKNWQGGNNKGITALSIDPLRTYERSWKSMAETYALHGREMSDAEVAAINHFKKHVDKEVLRKGHYPGLGEGPGKNYAVDLKVQDGYSPAMGLGFVDNGLPLRPGGELNYAHQELRNVAIPAMFGKEKVDRLAAKSAFLSSKKALEAFTETAVGKAIHDKGGRLGQDFIRTLKRYADPNLGAEDLQGFSGSVARILYSTHLGANLSSIVLNLTQPFLLAGTAVGAQNLLPAYVDAFKDMAKYASLRLQRHGLKPLAADTKLGLIEEVFEFSKFGDEGRNILGITPDAYDTVDTLTFSGRGQRSGSGGLRLVEEYLMKGFEKSEWFNRNVVAHATKRAFQKAGRNPRTTMTFADEAERLVLQTQFGQNELNTPRLFLKSPFWNNPLMRQFLTFPVRSMVGALEVMPRLGGERYLWGLANTTMRGLAMSAIIYEVGKNTIGADLSRGLYATAATDLVGGNRLLEDGNEWVPVPPVLDIPIDFIRGIAADDMDVVANSIARTIPGGVALNRALGIAPSLRESPLPDAIAGLQKTYVDYSRPTPDGLVPVFKGDGTLIDYRSPAELVAKGLGVDLGTYQQQGGLDNYLVKQREEIVQYRQEYLRYMAAGEYGRMDQVQREFQKKFGVPLTVNQRQIDAFIDGRNISRTERIMDRIPPEARSAYQQMVAASGGARNVPREDLRSIPNAAGRRRDQALETEALKRLLQARDQTGPATREQSFLPFSSF